MTETELLKLWGKARLHIVISQIAPTFLLIVTIWLTALGLSEANPLVRYAALGILLASGILGAHTQYAAATEAIAVSKDLSELDSQSHTVRQIVRFAPTLNIVRFVTPAIFLGIFVLLFVTLI
jgi:hypothetical protein